MPVDFINDSESGTREFNGNLLDFPCAFRMRYSHLLDPNPRPMKNALKHITVPSRLVRFGADA